MSNNQTIWTPAATPPPPFVGPVYLTVEATGADAEGARATCLGGYAGGAYRWASGGPIDLATFRVVSWAIVPIIPADTVTGRENETK